MGDIGTTFIWDSKNDNGQFVNNGVYYIKIEEKDEFGHTNVKITSISVMNIEQYVEIRIFNSAGELVRTIKENKNYIPDKIMLSVDDVLAIDKERTAIQLTYGSNPSDTIIWDGKNDLGNLVSGGTYEIQVIAKSANGMSVAASKTVLILNETKQFISNVKAYPNPYTGVLTNKLKFTWDYNGNGTVKIYIYNTAGELIRKIEGLLQAGYVFWDMTTSTGARVSDGNYVCIIEAKNSEGYVEKKKVKIAIVKK